MTEDRSFDQSEAVLENLEADYGSEAILLAQASTRSGTDGSSSSSPAVPGISIVVPDSDNRVTLSGTVSIEDITRDGDDLLLLQPDGSQIRIVGGALNIPTFIIGDIELPQEVLVAALDANGFNVAAGPGNTLSVSPQAPAGSGGEFEDSSGASIAGDPVAALGLLGDTSGEDGQNEGAGVLEDAGNIVSVLTGGVSAGGIVESDDNPGSVDADPVAARGWISFFDPDFGETRTAEVASRSAMSQALNGGGTLNAAQLDALLAGFSLDTLGGITVESTTAAGGSIGWTYFVGNDAVDFLASGEVITLSFDVRINDGIFSVTQTVTVTVTGTNDAPVIEATSSLADTITEQTDTTGAITPLTATGQIVLSDVDLTDTHTTSQTFVSAVWSGGAIPAVDPGALVIAAVDQGGDTADWTYTVADNALDFLAVGETLTITYDVAVQDDSTTGNDTSAVKQIVVVITGTNDQPAITSGAQSGTVDEQPDLAPATDADPAAVKGTISFDDVDLSDQPTASVTGSELTMATLANGYTLTAGQKTTLLDAFSLDAVNGVSNSSHGDGAGEIAWTYDATNAAIDFLGENDQLVLTFTVTVDDGHGGTAAQDVTITVNGTNDAPREVGANVYMGFTESADASPLADADPGLRTGSLIFTDVDLTDEPSATVTARTVSGIWLANGSTLSTAQTDALLNAFSLTDTVDGVDNSTFGDGLGEVSYNYDITNADIDFLGEGDYLILDFTITVDDGHGGILAQNVTVNIIGTNDAPVISSVTDVSETLAETEGALSTAGSFDVADVDTSDIVTITGVTVATSGNDSDAATPDTAALLAMFGPNSGVLIDSLSNTGTVNWTFDAGIDAFDYLAEGEHLELRYTVNLADGNGGTVAQDVTITINGTNDAPEVTMSAAVPLTDEDTTLIITGFSVADVDSDMLTVTLSSDHGAISLSGLSGLSFAAGDGAADATMTFTGSVADINAALAGMSFAPAANYSGQAGIDYTVSDGTAPAVKGTIDIDVAPVADGVVISTGPDVSADPAPLSDDVQVNTVTENAQEYANIAALADGGFVVTWSSFGQDGSGYGIYGQRYDAPGNPSGGEFRVNTHTASDQVYSSVAALPGGGFVVTWTSNGQDGSNRGIYGQRYDASGNPFGVEFQLNSHTTYTQHQSCVTALPDGGFLVTWSSSGQDGSGWGIYGQRFDAPGNPSGGEFQVNSHTAGQQDLSSVAALADGGFVISWSSLEQDGNGYGIYGQRYDAPGNAVGGEFQVNTHTASGQDVSNVAALPDGGFVVTWSSDGQDGSSWGIYAQRYDASGAESGSEFRVNTTTASSQFLSSVTGLPGGGFVVTWLSNGQDGSGVYGQRYDASGNAVGAEFRLSQVTVAQQIGENDYSSETTVVLADGTLVSVWTGDGAEEVFIRRFELPQAITGNEDTAIALSQLTVTLTDIDGSETITELLLSGAPDGATVSDGVNSVVSTGVVIDITGWNLSALTFQAPADASGTFTLTLSVVTTDTATLSTGAVSAIGAPVTKTFDVVVKPVNDAPVAAPVAVPSTDEDVSVAINDFSVADVDSGTLTVTLSSDHGAITLSGLAGLIFATGDGAADATMTFTGLAAAINAALAGMSFAPAANYSGQAAIAYSVSDGIAPSVTGSIDVDVAPVTDGVEITGPATDMTPLSGDVAVNTYTVSQQHNSSVAAIDGGYVIIWSSYGQDGSEQGIYSQRYAGDGTAQGGETRVNATVASSQDYATAAAIDGGYVVTWSSLGQDGSGWGIYSQRYASDGTPQGGETRVNTATAGNQFYSSVAAFDGGYVITWSAGTLGDYRIYAQRYANDGSPQGSETAVDITSVTFGQEYSSVAGIEGGYVVTWSSFGQDGDGWGVYSQRYANDGTPQGIVTRANTTVADQQTNSSVAAIDGGYVITWSSNGQDGNGTGIYSQRYLSDGTPQGAETQVNTYTFNDQDYPSVVAIGGGYLVSWLSLGQDGSGWGVYGQRFAIDGSRIGSEFRLNADVGGHQANNAALTGSGVAVTADGVLVAVWNQDDLEIEQRLFQLPQPIIGNEDSAVVLSPLSVALTGTDTDGSEAVTSLVLSGYPEGATFSVGTAGAGANLGKWVISDPAEIAAFNTTALTITPPLNYSGTFTLSVTAHVTDTAVLSTGPASSTASTSLFLSVLVNPVNDAPVAASVAVQKTDEDTTLIINDFSVADVDSGTLTVTLTADHGAITLSGLAGLSFTSGDGAADATMTFTGSVADINAALAGMSFAPTADYSGKAEIAYSVSDGTAPAVTGTIDVDVAPVADGAVIVVGPDVSGDPTPVSGDVQVNTTTANTQMFANIAALADGGFVVTWTSNLQDGDGQGIYGQRYDASGTPTGGEFRVNSTTAHSQTHSSVSALAGGGFVVTWTSNLQDGDGQGIYGQRYDASGTATGGEFRGNSTTVDWQTHSSVSALAGGGFVVTWASNQQDGDDYGIYGQRYDASGNSSGGEFQVNSSTASRQDNSSVTGLPDGGFIVTWSSIAQDGSKAGIYGQRYDAFGNTSGAEFQINTHTDEAQDNSSVTWLADGGFVVTWSSYGQDGDGWGIYGQRYDVSGNASGGEFRINSTTASSQFLSSVTGLADGGFVVTWSSLEQDGDGYGVYGQRYDVSGTAVGTEFRLNQITAGHQFGDSLFGGEMTVVLADGTLVSVWSGGGSGEVFFGRFELPHPAITGNEDTAIALSPLSVTLTDTDGSETITEMLVRGTPSGATVSDGVNSLVSTGADIDITGWNLSALTFQAPADASGTFTLTLSVTTTDAATLSTGPARDSATATRTFDVVVNPVNDAPAIAPVAQPAAIDEAPDASAQNIAPVTGTLSVIDADIGDTLTALAGVPVLIRSGGLVGSIPAGLVTALASGKLVLGTAVSNGGAVDISYTWDPSVASLDFLAAGETLKVTYDIGVSDGTVTSTAQPLTFTIIGTNDAPVLTGLVDGAIAENDVGVLIGSFNLSDADTAGGITFQVLDAANEVDGRFEIVAAVGTIVGQPGTYELRLKPGMSLDFEAENADADPSIGLTIKVDDHGGADNVTTVPVTVTVTDVDEPLVANADNVIVSTSRFGGSILIPEWALLANDTGGHGPLDITATGNDGGVSTSLVLDYGPGGGTEAVNIAFGYAGGGGGFNYTVSDGSSTTIGSVTFTHIDSSYWGRYLNGTNAADILVARTIVFPQSQVSVLNFDNNYDTGDVVSITVDGVVYSHTVPSTARTAENVYDALKAVSVSGVTLANSLATKGVGWAENLNDAKVVILTASSGKEHAFTISAEVDNSADIPVPWITGLRLEHSLYDGTTGIAGFGAFGVLDASEFIQITINGVAYSATYTDPSGSAWQHFNNAAHNLVNTMNDVPGVRASYSGGTYFRIETDFSPGLITGMSTADGYLFSYTTLHANGSATTDQFATYAYMNAAADDGGNILTGLDGNDILFGSVGRDTLIGGLGKDILTGGVGPDIFIFDADALSDAGLGIHDLIADYNFGGGDVIDLSALLGSQPVNAFNASDYVRTDGKFLTVDIDGAANDESFLSIAEFSSAPGHDALRILVDDNPYLQVII